MRWRLLPLIMMLVLALGCGKSGSVMTVDQGSNGGGQNDPGDTTEIGGIPIVPPSADTPATPFATILTDSNRYSAVMMPVTGSVHGTSEGSRYRMLDPALITGAARLSKQMQE